VNQASKIRARAEDWVENCLDPQAMARAVVAMLDFADELDQNRTGRFFAVEIRNRLGSALGIQENGELAERVINAVNASGRSG
jgi:hypothetical protein